MSLKMEFIEKANKPHARMSVLCREYGISRETGYKWLKRYQHEGYDGLEERSRRPKASPLATAEDLVMMILKLRERYPRRGPKKLQVQLARQLGAGAPSAATIARVLRRMGMIRQRSRYRRPSIVQEAPGVKADKPNDIWTVDFKGWWTVRDGQRCEPLTVRDAFSRFVLCAKAMPRATVETVKQAFAELFRRFGVPTHIHVDNGTPFINVMSVGGLTRLSAWWISLGIIVVRSRPACPQDNGGHERMHRDIAEDVQAFPSESRAAEQRALDRWRQDFNHVRPHEALGGKTPAEVYVRSERRPKKTTYFYPPGWVVRTVTPLGLVNIRGAQCRAGQALARERVALEPLGGRQYRLWFRHLDLGEVTLDLGNTDIDTICQDFITHLSRRKAA